MLIESSQLNNASILSLQTGVALAHVSELIIDPRQLQIVATYCKGGRLEFDPAILHTADIREFGQMGIIVDSSDVIMPPDQLVRLEEIISFHFSLIDILVIDDRKKKLGKVTEFVVDTSTFLVQKLYIKPSLMHRLITSQLVIDRSQIIDVSNQTITVKSADIRAAEPTEQAVRPLPPVDNPFRTQPAESDDAR